MENTLDVFINIIINACDVAMAFYLCHSLIEKRPSLSVKWVLFWLVSSTIMGVTAEYLNVYLFKTICLVIIMVLLKLISKKRIHGLAITYTIVYINIIFAQILSVLIISPLHLNQYLMAIIAQGIAFILVFLMIRRLPLYKLLYTLEKELLLQLLFFTIFGLFLVIFFYFNFEYEDMKAYVIYFSILISISCICLYKTLKELFFYTKKVPVKLHDMMNILTGIYISLNGTSDINEVRADVNHYYKVMDIHAEVDDVIEGEQEDNIMSFIHNKKLKSQKKLVFITDVHYYERNKKISIPSIIYMLGLLLDNAIEASQSDKPILVSVSVSEHCLDISVANEYERKSANDFEKMFQDGYSTKSDHSRGYGLPNLSKIVTKYDGDVLVHHEYNEEQKGRYLTMHIRIRNRS